MTRIRIASAASAAILAACGALLGACGADRTEPPPADPGELLVILGDVANREEELDGRWRPARDGSMAVLTREEREMLDELGALPYTSGSVAAQDRANVTVYDPASAYDGVNLYSSGHGPEAFLIDMEGHVLHRWRHPIERIWPEVPHTMHSTFWRRVNVYPNGDLLAIFEGIGIVKLDRRSNLLWSYRGGSHHEAFITEDGKIYVLTREGRMVPRINPDEPILTDSITILDGDGRVEKRVPLLESLESSSYASLLSGIRPEGDIFHTNSIYVFDGSKAHLHPYYRKGNVLVSIYKLDAVAIVDMDRERVVWARSGGQVQWRRQHDPTVLANGNILLFDNLGRGGRSRVIEFDPESGRLAWVYPGKASDELYSKTCGTSDRLPNGNTLITESDNGRALEVTPDKKIVWEFYNPNRAGDDDELIATLFELTRYDRDTFDWLDLD